jgi:hypothetical protein
VSTDCARAHAICVAILHKVDRLETLERSGGSSLTEPEWLEALPHALVILALGCLREAQFKEAQELLEEASSLGQSVATELLIDMLLHGITGPVPDAATTTALQKQAAEADNDDVMQLWIAPAPDPLDYRIGFFSAATVLERADAGDVEFMHTAGVYLLGGHQDFEGATGRR